ncbi:universal stress protein [Corynebacterium sanguinis]|uniref:Universal stress protein n=1 Tax=Corynebacterium sanguinis TaxID=2594913 RepID=A0A6I7R5A0_9CORY|nr:universal stress protein [Corynebacterium sanguinis]MBA4505544.1 universal stress protein [Corynebacterium sanguinis]MCT1426447.1 universal stress protein [Corynebacterium sanguinis]MCT1556018.1 universal stress protein [Corynebacterium sanguinis]MCT1598300.1 universal stress protein [Corynebacterium sanguinis]MCT1614385.1 universal stress protein [Corynebacterium sanguinis]
MHTYSSIAVGTDGSATSLMAVRAAASMARVYDADLTVICAHYSANTSLLNSSNAEQSKVHIVTDDDAARILGMAEDIAREEQAPRINLMAKPGMPANVLLDAVQETGADLLVVGNKGMRTLAGRIFGNIPGDVAKKAPVDVVLVDTRAEGHD